MLLGVLMTLFPCPSVYLPAGIPIRPFIAHLHIRCTFPEPVVCSFQPVHLSIPATSLLFWRTRLVGAEVLVVRFGKTLPMEKDANGSGGLCFCISFVSTGARKAMRARKGNCRVFVESMVCSFFCYDSMRA